LSADQPSLIDELKRRRVFRAVIGYGVVAFALLQIIEPIMHGLHWPDEVLTWLVVALAVGFPIVVGLAWIFDVNAGRIERTGKTKGLQGARLLSALAGIAALAAAPGLLWYLVLRPGARAKTGEVAAASVAAPAGILVPSIAVLPFVDLSPAKDQEYFSDGISEEILNALAQIDGLHVAGRTSSFSFKGKNEDLRTVGQKLGVGVVLEGSVRKSDKRVRVTAQAIKVADGFHIWSQTYDREQGDIFAVQDEIARSVAEVIQVKLLPGKAIVPEARRTTSPAAYSEFLWGRQLYNRHTENDYRLSVEAFERALALDPAYAPAHAGLCTSLGFWVNTAQGTPSWRTVGQRRAMAEAAKAVALAPDLPEARIARAISRMVIDLDWAGAGSDLAAAVQSAPGDARTYIWQGQYFAAIGKLPEAIAVTRKGVALDRLDPLGWDYLGRYLAASGQLAEAREAFAQALRAAPGDVWAPRELGFTMLLANQPAEALALFEKQQGWIRLVGVALSQHSLGHQREAKAALDGLLALDDPPTYQVAQVYAWWGDRDRAFTMFDRAIREEDSGLRYVQYDPLLRDLREDRRYVALLQKLKLQPAP
jgi:TolB-like protein